MHGLEISRKHNIFNYYMPFDEWVKRNGLHHPIERLIG